MRNDDAAEFISIQRAAEDLLREIAASELPPNAHTISRLEKLAAAGAKLAYGSGYIELESEEMHNLIAWCDHLNDAEWRSQFIRTLAASPLRSPFKG